MAKICQITKKKSTYGKCRSHAMNSTNRKFYSNIHFHRFWLESKKKFIRIKVSKEGLKIIDKYGIEQCLKIIYSKKKNIKNGKKKSY